MSVREKDLLRQAFEKRANKSDVPCLTDCQTLQVELRSQCNSNKTAPQIKQWYYNNMKNLRPPAATPTEAPAATTEAPTPTATPTATPTEAENTTTAP